MYVALEPLLRRIEDWPHSRQIVARLRDLARRKKPDTHGTVATQHFEPDAPLPDVLDVDIDPDHEGWPARLPPGIGAAILDAIDDDRLVPHNHRDLRPARRIATNLEHLA